MAYMRGQHYVYVSNHEGGGTIHFHVSEMNMKTFDELVAMRAAQLVEEHGLEAAEDRALQHHAGNIGCDALCRKHGLPGFSERLEELVRLREARP